MIIKGTVEQKKKERERCKDKVSSLYILGLDHQINTLSWVLTEIDAIKRNAHGVSDEIVTRMDGSSKAV
jgi:RNase P/RNase MRP subunit p30